MLAAGLVVWLDSPWPDLIVGTLVSLLFLRTAVTVLRGGWQDWHPRAVTGKA
jgi:Co/Zn/Cd efflux system component